MRKQGKQRKAYGNPRAPILVMRQLEEVEIESREWKAVNVLAYGNPTTDDFNTIQDMLNLLLVAGNSTPERKYAHDMADNLFKPVIMSIQQRFNKTGRWGVTATELVTLRKMVVFNREFWIRQPTELLAASAEEVKAFYLELSEKAAA
ncbi:MAG: hypothetical protein ACAH12_03425 [Methylophilaceae bacterium]